MSWYWHSDSQPNSIESQIHNMLFNDLTYRAIVSVRESVDANATISARSPTLAYLLDQGYVLSQVLALQKLLDKRRGMVSVKRLLAEIEEDRGLITREVYVAGDGLPYDCDAWPQDIDKTHPMIQMWGIDAPALHSFASSKFLHETFDVLSGKQVSERARDDVIPKSVFRKLDSWISTPAADQIAKIRHNFIAHAANAINLGSLRFNGVRFAHIDELQRAIVRVERALTDHILAIRVERNVVPMAPLGLFRGLDSIYSRPEDEKSMYYRWSELSEERDGWSRGVLEELTTNGAGRDASDSSPPFPPPPAA